jgi:hypothetical protein
MTLNSLSHDCGYSQILYLTKIHTHDPVILKFVRQFEFAKCQKIRCQETSKGIRFCVAQSARLILVFYDYSYFSYNFSVTDVKIQIMRTIYEIII